MPKKAGQCACNYQLLSDQEIAEQAGLLMDRCGQLSMESISALSMESIGEGEINIVSNETLN